MISAIKSKWIILIDTTQARLHKLIFFTVSASHVIAITQNVPDSKVLGANIGPIWGLKDPGGPHAGAMNFAILGTLLPPATTTKQSSPSRCHVSVQGHCSPADINAHIDLSQSTFSTPTIIASMCNATQCVQVSKCELHNWCQTLDNVPQYYWCICITDNTNGACTFSVRSTPVKPIP